MASSSDVPADLEASPPRTSNSGNPVNYAPPSEIPHTSHKAPSLKDVGASRSKQKIVYTKKTSNRKADRKKSPATRLPSPTQVNSNTANDSPLAPMKATTSSPLDELAESTSAELQLSVILKHPVLQDNPKDGTPSAYLIPFRDNSTADGDNITNVIAPFRPSFFSKKKSTAPKANDIRSKVDLLENSHPLIINKIDRLRARRDKLLKELDSVNAALTAEESKLENLPIAIKEMKENMKTPVCEAVRLHKLIKPISRTTDEDQQKINEINQIRLGAIDSA
ncbi:hypothetical protein C2845_PM09G12930 [Panicum miliaceum]|uniref:Aminotransferase-like protein n=1 Tax=Panicum miliaceum TaxID=4540 RepID=A0A3L6S1P2_PANMI|nr:hypothetical protein C2845_PM09G12930 [Panicum miliaceum]